MLAIGITPSSYDDNYYPYGVDRPDIFGDVRTRQALAYCIDTQTIVNKLLGGGSVNAANALIPDGSSHLAGLHPGWITPMTLPKGLNCSSKWDGRRGFQPADTPITAVNVVAMSRRAPSFEIGLLTSESGASR